MTHRVVRQIRGRLAGVLGALGVLGIASVAWSADEFGPSSIRLESFCVGNEVCEVGDFNGDGAGDVVTFVHGTIPSDQGAVYVALGIHGVFGGGFLPPTRWHDFFCLAGEICKVGDFDGDGKDDIGLFTRGGEGRVSVALSRVKNGVPAFGSIQTWLTGFCFGEEVCDVGDFDGDQKDDVITFVRSTKAGSAAGDVFVAKSKGGAFAAATRWHGSFCFGQEVCKVGDFNGDGDDDIAAFVRSTKTGSAAGDVFVARSIENAKFDTSAVWHTDFCIGSEICEVGDVNGDGQDDLVTFLRSTRTGTFVGDVRVVLSQDTQFQPVATLWHDFFCIQNEICKVRDFDGDGVADIATFIQGGAGSVYLSLSTYSQLRDWTFDLNRVKVVVNRDKGGLLDPPGDEPYFVVYKIRTRPLVPGSTDVTWSRDLREIGEDLAAGKVRDIPNSMGRITFPGVQRMNILDVLLTGKFPEIFGTIIISMESNCSDFDSLRPVFDSLGDALERELARQLETLPPIPPPPAGATVDDFADALGRALADRMASFGIHARLSGQDLFDLLVGICLDPDRPVGIHGEVFLAADPFITNALQKIIKNETDDLPDFLKLGNARERVWHLERDPIEFKGAGSEFHTEALLTSVPR